MTRLLFYMEQVAGLVRHSGEVPQRHMTMAQRARIYGEERCATHQPGEERLAPPCLWLVKDEGIYLMSPGIHPDAGPGDRPARAPVTYASAFDPTRHDRMAVWARARDAVGGDDFAEAVPLEWVDAALKARSPEFALEFGPDAIGLLLPAASGDASDVPPPRRRPVPSCSCPAPSSSRAPGAKPLIQAGLQDPVHRRGRDGSDGAQRP